MCPSLQLAILLRVLPGAFPYLSHLVSFLRPPCPALGLETAPCFLQFELRFALTEVTRQRAVHDPVVTSEHSQCLSGDSPVIQRLVGNETAGTTRFGHHHDSIP